MTTTATFSPTTHRLPLSHPLSLERGYHRHSDNVYVGSLLTLLAVCGDIACICLALVGGFWLRFFTSLVPPKGDAYTNLGEGLSDYLGLIVFGTIVFVGLLGLTRSYAREAITSHKTSSRSIIRGVLLWTAVFLSLALILRLGPGISRLFVLYAAAAGLVFLLTWRYVLTSYVRTTAVPDVLAHRVLIVGWNESAQRLLRHFEEDESGQYNVVGYIAPEGTDFQGTQPEHLRRFRSIDELDGIVRRLGVDLVILAEIAKSQEYFSQIATICEKHMINFKAIPSDFGIMLKGLGTNLVGDVPLLGFESLPLNNPFNRIFKRAFDIVVGAGCLLISAPIIAVFGYLVYRESPGPIFYRQRRTGRHGRTFEIIKIRSMKLNAEANGKVGWTQEDDPRRLKIGSLMRRLNVDELPQFWNVLHGEMSIVGPRPERPEHIQRLKETIPHYNARHLAKPGITGWAQINGWRGDTDLNERIRHDLHYLENWSLGFDLKIFVRTFLAGKNAY
jgi:exopolysaccharide biosynthesis polyprenyl glycosylphosphotransferase